METPKGREASMYGPLRDVFALAFGYQARDIDIDTAGDGGRPDLTVRAATGLTGTKGRPHLIAWIVLEVHQRSIDRRTRTTR